MRGAVARHPVAIAVCALVAIVAGLYAGGVFPELPDAKKVIEDVAQALGPWTYALVAAAAFLETGAFVGLIAPGETTVIVAGVIAGQGEIDLLPLIGLVWLSAALGDTASFFLGRRLGRDFLVRHGPRFKIGPDRLEQVESYFDQHGGKTILIGRFIGLVRALAPFVAGTSGLDYRRFLPFSVIGCGLWSALFSVLGYVFYESFDRVAAIAGQATLAFGMTVALVVGSVYVYRRLRREEDRRRLAAWSRRQAEKPLLRPLARALAAVRDRLWPPAARVLGPAGRFVRDRFVPGELGLELTGALAVSGVGTYVFALYASIFAAGDRLTPADGELLDLADDLRDETAISVLGVVTDIGAVPAVCALLLAAGAVLVARRRFAELGVLVVGSILVYVCTQLAKAGIDRPRPPDPLVVVGQASYPSGHAALSTVWVAAAIMLARAAFGRIAGVSLVGVGLAIAATVGLTRIYLRVHYWSDVAGGWGLGVAVFGICSIAALAVGHIVQNGFQPATSAGQEGNAHEP